MTKADCIVFTGGSDVDPSLYGESKTTKVLVTDLDRDHKEMAVFKYAVSHGIPMIGICRGAQFLNVMNGGKLVQHANGHSVDHKIRIPTSVDYPVKEFVVTSTHHQLIVPNIERGHQLLGYTEGIATHLEGVPFKEYTKYSKKYSAGETIAKEAEVLWYETTGSLCVQYHPEQMKKGEDGYQYFKHLVEEYVML